MGRLSYSARDIKTRNIPQRTLGTDKWKIYTKTGDKGTSALFTGERRHKNDAVFEGLGVTDELTSAIGFARELCIDNNHDELVKELEDIQCILQEICSNIATPASSTTTAVNTSATQFNAEYIDLLESWIDKVIFFDQENEGVMPFKLGEL